MAEKEVKVVLEMTLEQARANAAALDFYARMCMGQLQEVTDLVSKGELSPGTMGQQLEAKKMASVDQCRAIDDLAASMKQVLGFTSGGSHSIGSKQVSETAHRSWELKKVLDQALAMHWNPNPQFRGVNYDGLMLRYTKDKAPVCVISVD